MSLNKLLLYFNTLKYLQYKQLTYNIVRRLFKRQRFIDAAGVTNHQLRLVEPIQYDKKIDHESVCFLNERRSFSYISNWTCADEPKLWRYNLHYFDFLLDPGAAENIKDKLINDWIVGSHHLSVDAWEPYPLSLRIVNWIKYFVVYKNNSVPAEWLESLCQQAYVLSNSIEYHILANHYLKNGKGLLFAGAYLNCRYSKQWFSTGMKILLDEANEQILKDGGHYEKSPMYHLIITEDYLDSINLINGNSLDVNGQDVNFIINKTNAALNFLNYIVMPDGEIPLFNDSSFKIAPCPDGISSYAERVIGCKRIIDQNRQSIMSLDESGYYIIKDDNNMCVIDCGSVGPDYQPGHTHCDILSYELALDGKRLIIDTGVCSYEDNDDRHYSRSTASHNTVVIDGNEQSELWGVFRVARRAKIRQATLRQATLEGRDYSTFTGSYSPYWCDNANIIHQRKIVYNYDGEWKFSDLIEGDGEYNLESYIHFHPDIEITRDDNSYLLTRAGKVIAQLSVADGIHTSVSEGCYFPEFGKRYKINVVTMSVHAELPVTMWYTIKSYFVKM